jgi:uncharacterized YccA/Bax inhibitor family protein
MMTLDDVVVRTVALLALTGVSGALSWILIPQGSPAMVMAMVGSLLAGLVLNLVITFARVTNPFVIGAYAVVEGVFLGVASRMFESFYNGIVIQAVIGTFAVFAIMGLLYKLKVLRATPVFTKVVVGAMLGLFALSFVNLFAYFAGHQLFTAGLTGKVGWLPIVFAIVCLIFGALTFVLDFDQVEQGVRYGMPEKWAWYCAFGLLAGLIFVYWQILRLLSYLRR